MGIIADTDMQDIQKQVLGARNLLNQLNTNGIDGDSALGVIAGCGGLGASSFTAGAIMGGGLAASGLAGMAVVGGLLAAPALAILVAISADEMEKKLYPHIPLKEFYAKNAEVCNALQEANHMDISFRVILNQ